jgi:thiamine-monophosphate kinase
MGARIMAHSLPGVDALGEVSSLIGAQPEHWAVSGGEDYELLFTARPEVSDRLLDIGRQCTLQLTPVGTIVPGTGVTLIRELADGTFEESAIAYQGFDHFRDRGEG